MPQNQLRLHNYNYDAHQLDLSVICAEYERRDGRGLSAYHPVMLARLLLFGYCIGKTSSRRIEFATYDN
ncbi:MAG: hypothetical protein LAP21_21860 [Acidobacteriia bacterium]|nr:hypothetical protein [Terriglobia bacterium]